MFVLAFNVIFQFTPHLKNLTTFETLHSFTF